jgi:hypothetical protein
MNADKRGYDQTKLFAFHRRLSAFIGGPFVFFAPG